MRLPARSASVVTCVWSAPYDSCRTRSTLWSCSVHALEGVLQRADVAREVRLGQLEKARAIRVQGLGRERLDRGSEALVA